MHRDPAATIVSPIAAALHAASATADAPAAGSADPAEVFLQVGALTRLLHDTLAQLGVMPRLQRAADGLPDARSRLNYVAEKTACAAGKVLDTVDRAKAEQAAIAARTYALADALTRDPVRAVASGAVLNFVHDVETAVGRTDAHLTEIMLAQDFHDLTGQVVAKVIGLANDLESSLVKLLVQVTPADQAHKVGPSPLDGPVVDARGRTDVVTSQGEVDDLLASVGF